MGTPGAVPAASHELVRDPDDRRRWELPGLGSFRLAGYRARKSTIDVGGRTLQVATRGMFPGRVEFSEDGRAVGSFVPRGMFTSGATLELDGRRWTWEVPGRLRYEMTDGDAHAAIDARHGRRTVTVEAGGPAADDPVALVVGAFLAKVAFDVKRRRRNAAIAGSAGSAGS